MKKIIATLTLLSSFYFPAAEAQVKMPAPSPVQTIRQDFGMGRVELTYSRPSARGRKVFGDVVPYGKLWRTGANAPVKIVFTEPVTLCDKKIDTGTYVLYTIPGEESWVVILNKGLGNWGVDGYKESEDVARCTVPSSTLKQPVETFTMQFGQIKPESCTLEMMWEKRAVSVPITTNIKDKLRAQIESAMSGEKKPYWQAAQFYNEYDKNLPKALENVTRAVEANPKAYWIMLYKARIQKEMSDIAGATQSANASRALAKEEGNDDYVKMNDDLLKELKKMK
jgi:hypothetical protein